MNKILIPYAATLLVMVALDLLWLGVIAKPIYQQGIGHLMAERPNLIAAGVFYVVFAAGLLVFAVMSPTSPTSVGQVALRGALFGFFAYATYDLTNLATLKQWPLGVALLDMAWGSAISAVSAGAGKFALDRWTHG